MTMYPKLCVNTNTLVSNIQRLRDRLQLLNIQLRPHLKTIHDPFLSTFLMDQNISKVSVSNIDMATLFIEKGWSDICLAVTCPIQYLDQLQRFVDQGVNITLYIDSEAHLKAIEKYSGPFNICIEIDCGQFRSGIDWKSERLIKELIHSIQASSHCFSGLSSHFGFLYEASSKSEIIAETGNAMMKILQLKEHLEVGTGLIIPVAIGDTPSTLAMDMFDNVAEIRSGNFMLNDLQIQSKGLCEYSNIAAVLQAEVTSVQPQDCRFVLHCGSVHLSKDRHQDPSIGYGLVAKTNLDSWWDTILPNTRIIELYQEHAVVVTTPEIVDAITLGDIVTVVPVHSCLTMDAMFHKNRIEYSSS